jgi:outer membrane protein assembly factor BamA
MRRATFILIAWVAIAVAPCPEAQAQEIDTRGEELRRQREEKSRALTPPKPNKMEKALLDLESGRLFERILNPPEGIYPRIGQITSGSGFSLGPGYRHAGLFGGSGAFSAFAAASFTRYWMLDARLQFPQLASGHAGAEVHAQRFEFPKEQFFGLGPDSERSNFVTYGFAGTDVGGTAAYRPTSDLAFTGAISYLRPAVSPGSEPGEILSVFNLAQVPGLFEQPDFFKYETGIELNRRQPRGNPRSGGRYALTLQRFDDIDTNRFSFNRVEVDLQQYVPLLRDRRVLALHGAVSMSDADSGAEVPFYLQRTLGGPDDLRGFHRFRFRDRHMLLMQAEYRWEIFTAVDGAIFYDAGKVASRTEDLNFRDLETDYGIGFRFGTMNGIFLRIEGAFGSSEGKHFILRFGHVF